MWSERNKPRQMLGILVWRSQNFRGVLMISVNDLTPKRAQVMFINAKV